MNESLPLNRADATTQPPKPPSAHRHSYGVDLIFAMLFFIEPTNLIPFAVVCAANGLLLTSFFIGTQVFVWGNLFILNIGLLGPSLFVAGWLFGYYLRIILDTADDDDILPDTMMGGLFEAILQPMFQCVVMCLVLLAPAIGLYYIGASLNTNIERSLLMLFALPGVPFWPVAVLSVALGGVGALFRVDVIFGSVIKTITHYLLLWVVLGMLGCGFVVLAVFLTTAPFGAAPIMNKQPLAAFAVLTGTLSYVSIVFMRAIGVYYRHAKDRSLWTWE